MEMDKIDKNRGKVVMKKNSTGSIVSQNPTQTATSLDDIDRKQSYVSMARTSITEVTTIANVPRQRSTDSRRSKSRPQTDAIVQKRIHYTTTEATFSENLQCISCNTFDI